MMRAFPTILLLLTILFAACGGAKEAASPKRTFETYITALAKNDIKTVKLLLSNETIKMHEQEAKTQNVSLDEIIKRETLFTPGQKVVQLRNEKIEGEKATLEVKNSFDEWETVPFVFENNEWKIDKKGFTEQILQEAEQGNQEMENIINQGKQP